MDKLETIEVESRRIACDGGGEQGHPKIYLSIISDEGRVVCPYCSKCYILTGSINEIINQ
jgi:uncharacterized Zn-finger protein